MPQEVTMQSLRQQLTVFLLSGGMAMALLQGARRMTDVGSLGSWLRGGATLVFGLGCASAGIAMLLGAWGDLGRLRGAARGTPLHRPIGPVGVALRLAVGAMIGLVIPGWLAAAALGNQGG